MMECPICEFTKEKDETGQFCICDLNGRGDE